MSHSFVDSTSGLECIRVILYQLYIIIACQLPIARTNTTYNFMHLQLDYMYILPFRTHVIAQSYYTSIDAKCIPLHVCSIAYLVRKRERLWRSPSLLCEVKVSVVRMSQTTRWREICKEVVTRTRWAGRSPKFPGRNGCKSRGL